MALTVSRGWKDSGLDIHRNNCPADTAKRCPLGSRKWVYYSSAVGHILVGNTRQFLQNKKNKTPLDKII